jgi:hypothetical protein
MRQRYRFGLLCVLDTDGHGEAKFTVHLTTRSLIIVNLQFESTSSAA